MEGKFVVELNSTYWKEGKGGREGREGRVSIRVRGG